MCTEYQGKIHKNRNKLIQARRRFWMRSLFLRRGETTETLVEDLANHGVDDTIKNFIRLSRGVFYHLLDLITPAISKMDTNMRRALTPLERICITLRFLATGDSYDSLSILFRVSRQPISRIVPEVCDAIIAALKEYILPSTHAQWMEISDEFERKWNFPHVIGAIDGKHISITAPKNSGAEFYNYKQFYSIVLLGIVDANYGCESDGGIFANSSIYQELENNRLAIPEPTTLGSSDSQRVPYMLLGDKAFALAPYMMTPFSGTPVRNSPERVFNYRHSRARRTVENAFGILSSVFRVLRKPMLLEPKIAEKVVLATVYLHNFSRKRNYSEIYMPSESIDREVNGQVVDGSWRGDIPTTSMIPLQGVPRRSAQYLQNIRSSLAHYFFTDNILPGQHRF
uniref:DDE Tnp4 domain-containing protein n=1 Tax=Anopheles atroparvus TaxID=41427 RepID=A0AAG5DSG4_ANOAO